MKSMRILQAALLVLPLSGCATIFSGTSQRIRVTTRPKDADITVLYGEEVVYEGKAPWSGSVGRKFKYPTVVEARKEGFIFQRVELRKARSGWYRWNFLTLWLGMIVDRISGAAWKYPNPAVHIPLEEKKAPPPPDIARRDDPSRATREPGKPKTITDEDVVFEDDYDSH